jgi:2-polyprenyl-6-methoxyphenol hydroxylase-like FAD-dependent oxidoreductase
MMGQGANMAIVDGFVAAQRLAAAMQSGTEGAIEQALVDYDCETRRKNNTKVIKKARRYGQWSVSRNRFVSWLMRTTVKYLPASTMINELVSGDKSNKKFAESLRKDLGETIGSTGRSTSYHHGDT